MAAHWKHHLGDIWGGLAAMLVALPAAIAFGVAIYAPLGSSTAAQGAMAGLLGAMVLGIVAPLLGGTDRLITAPCAPAAAVMGALALSLVSAGEAWTADQILLLLTVTALLAGMLQILYGLAGGGTLIKYIPYPVVTGYLSGVGIVIVLKQLPGFFGWPEHTPIMAGLFRLDWWQWPSVGVGLTTVMVMLFAPRLTKAVPAAVIGLLSGIGAYFAMGYLRPELLTLTDNRWVIGPIAVAEDAFMAGLSARWHALESLHWSDLERILIPALTLSVLLSIDTLKTCVVVDAITRSRHHSNREVIGQGVANVCSALAGGIPGAGTSGATLVNLASGGRTRWSSILEGVFMVLAFWLLSHWIAWVPIAALAGILVVVGLRMFDWSSFRLLRQRSTLLDFAVIAIVIAVSVGVGLITASGVGVALAIILFLRDQVHSSVIHRRTFGNQVFSRQQRLPEEMALLAQQGQHTLVCELQGNLFFGTTDQLFTELEKDLKNCHFLILDLHRVRSVDFTAVHMLEQIQQRLQDSEAHLIFSALPRSLPTGQDLRTYFYEVGLLTDAANGQVFDQLSDALEWVENRILENAGCCHLAHEQPLNLRDMPMLKGRKEDTLKALEACVIERCFAPGDVIFQQGDHNDAIYLIRCGSVRIELNLEGKDHFHVATFSRGDFFGDMAFLDGSARSANAIAITQTQLLELSRQCFDRIANVHPRLGREFFANLALTMAIRLRAANAEIRALEER